MLGKDTASLFEDPGSHFITGLGQFRQVFADAGKVGFDKLVVAEGEQAEAVVDAEVFENHLLNTLGWMRWFCTL